MSSIRSVDSITTREAEAMHALMTRHYEAVPRARFDADLAEKDEVVMLHDDVGALRGFTTLAWNPAGELPEGDILFSGDTIIDESCWGTQELVRAFCQRAGAWRATSGRRLFWLLISKGHRTYLYLPLFARRFHPHPEHVEQEWQDIAARVAETMFGDSWQEREGVVRFAESHGHLRGDLADDTRGKQDNPWVRFFLERNPRYDQGEELVCLTEMTDENLRRGALAAFREGFESAS
ncbi:hypothetical protein [Luteolibacter arcticus]|uniref:hypothetical protein n=1 Tax=Luteolibacter arcticus TaxID=1581411 RepID=UPI0022215C09|nr:hypothetical protein [Luteolibacter arcticus]